MNIIKRQEGFSTPKALLLGTATLIVAGTGVYGWQVNNVVNTTESQTQKVATTTAAVSSPQNGSHLNTFTVPNEGLTFSYPKWWTHQEHTSNNGDSVTLTTKNNFKVLVQDNNLAHPGGDVGSYIAADDATFVGQKVYLDFVGDNTPNQPSDGTVAKVTLAQSSSNVYDSFKTRNMNPQGYLTVSAYYTDGNGKLVSRPLDQFKGTEDYRDFMNLVSSLRY